jgi:hypothetical protein
LARVTTLRTAPHPKPQEQYNTQLARVETKEFTAKLSNYFEAYVEIPRMKVGKRQTIETLINEEALLFAKYLRNERKEWIPRRSALGRNLKQTVLN